MSLKGKHDISSGMLKIIVVSVLLLAGVFGYVYYTIRPNPIKIGAILSLSGPAAHLVDVKNGMLMAVNEQNAMGGVNGRKIELIIEDSQTNPGEAVKAFHKIEATHQPLMYFSTNSSIALNLAPFAEERKVVLMALVAVSPKIIKDRDWVYTYWPDASDEVKPILTILKKQKIKKLGILYINDAFGTSSFNLIQKGFENTGGTVESRDFNPETKSFEDKLVALKNTQAIYLIGFSGQIEQMIQQIKKVQYNGLIIGSSGTHNVNLTQGAPLTNGIYAGSPAIYDPAFPFGRELREEYETLYKKQISHQAAGGYDSIMVIAGLLRDQEISRNNIRRLLRKGFVNQGLLGETHLRKGDQKVSIKLAPSIFKDGDVNFIR